MLEIQRVDGALTPAEKDEALRQLRDQVWWLSLPCWRRWLYMAFGHRAPVQHFYPETGWWREFVHFDVKPLWRRSRGG